MKLAHFYESAGKISCDDAEAGRVGGSRRVELARSVIVDLLDQYRRLAFYENTYGPNLADEREDATSLDVLRSIWQMFHAWSGEAEPVYDSVSQDPLLRSAVLEFDTFRDCIMFARLRVRETPGEELEAVRRLRRGEGIRTTVQELRDELRARRRA